MGVKIIISHDVVFNENEMLSMRTNTVGTEGDYEKRSLILYKDHFEFEVELSSQDGHDQQNGLAERMNRKLLDRVRCMLYGSCLSKHFWGETVMIVCYLVNRTASSAIDFKTP